MKNSTELFYGVDFEFGDIIEYKLTPKSNVERGIIVNYSRSSMTGEAFSFRVSNKQWIEVNIYADKIIRVFTKSNSPEYFL